MSLAPALLRAPTTLPVEVDATGNVTAALVARSPKSFPMTLRPDRPSSLSRRVTQVFSRAAVVRGPRSPPVAPSPHPSERVSLLLALTSPLGRTRHLGAGVATGNVTAALVARSPKSFPMTLRPDGPSSLSRRVTQVFSRAAVGPGRRSSGANGGTSRQRVTWWCALSCKRYSPSHSAGRTMFE
jgi:hypothetical protein